MGPRSEIGLACCYRILHGARHSLLVIPAQAGIQRGVAMDSHLRGVTDHQIVLQQHVGADLNAVLGIHLRVLTVLLTSCLLVDILRINV